MNTNNALITLDELRILQLREDFDCAADRRKGLDRVRTVVHLDRPGHISVKFGIFGGCFCHIVCPCGQGHLTPAPEVRTRNGSFLNQQTKAGQTN